MAENSEKSFPFNADLVNGEYDRVYHAEDWARYFMAFISSGTFLTEPTNLQVIANGDMTVTLKPGSMMIDGYRYDNVSDIIIPLEPADGVLSRTDRISVTWSAIDRDIHYTLQKGNMSYEPVAPECRRTAEYKDYVVADITVSAGAINISQTDIVDQRLNSEVCGLAVPFTTINTERIFLQLQAFYDQTVANNSLWQQEEKEKIDTWFNNIKNQLSGDIAINLQNQIGMLSELTTTEKENLVAAINEVNEKEVDVLDTVEEIEANTDGGKVAGALPVKQIINSLTALKTNFQDGVNKIVSAVNTKAGTTLTSSNTPTQISDAINGIKTSSTNRLTIVSEYHGDGAARDYCVLTIYRDNVAVYTMYFNALPNSGLARNVTF